MKTFREFIYNCELLEGKVEWDNPKRPLQSGLTPREKNRAKRISIGIEDTDKPSFYRGGLGEKEYERYGKLQVAHNEQKDKKVSRKERHKFKKDWTLTTVGQARRGNTEKDIGDTNPKRREIYSGKLGEGKVEWDNPRRPLQSGLTPREKNRAKRISIGLENPDKVSFGGKSYDLSDRDYERYGKLKIAHDDEKGKKTPIAKKHEFKQIEDIEGTLVGTRGRRRRKWKDHKNLPGNSKLWKQNERQKIYHHNDLKEPKESFDYELEESSTGERLGRRQRESLTGGRAFNKMTRKERITASIAKRAGIRGTGRLSTKDLRTKSSNYNNYDGNIDTDYGSTEQDHYIHSHESPRAFASKNLVKKLKRKRVGRVLTNKMEVVPSSKSVSAIKDFKRSLTKSGANKRGKVHEVDILPRDPNVAKGDPTDLVLRGKNFIQAIKDTPKELKKAGAKKRDPVVGKPSAIMDNENEKTGVAKRAKLYKKIFGHRSSKKSPRHGFMVGASD